MNGLPSLHAVAIAGGSGTRFWPLSRHHHPKQLLNLSGQDTLLHATMARMQPMVPPERWWMVVGQAHADGCRQVVPEVPSGQVVVEPIGRNTAPAIALAALHVAHKDANAIMAVLPADHHVADTAAFREAVGLAHQGASEGRIMTLGIEPTHPETGFGYIERGERLVTGGSYRVVRFVEKPSLTEAKTLLSRGTFVWNAGIFVMQARAYLQAVEAHLPKLHAALVPVRDAIGKGHYEAALAQAFDAIEGISIDYGVMEHVQNAGVVPVRCGWSDVGAWNALGSVVPADAAGNVVRGATILQDCKGCTAWASEGHVVAMIGLQDTVAVHTPDATLVMPAARSQDVRDVLATLKARGWKQFQ
jgi:mannose-1-phosphate guanylyltransferase